MITKLTDFLKEAYSKDKEEILNFIEELPDPVVLYRTLFLTKGEKINKNQLGESWTLDYNFAENAYHYKSFYPNNDDIMKIIHIEVPKRLIDIDKTVDRRLITDTEKYFWDELTDEWIENTDLDFHSYEHEQEIVLKNISELKKYITKIESTPLEGGYPKKETKGKSHEDMFPDLYA
jgi:hypothetical protein